MAKLTTCDICKKEAITTAEFKTDTTTPIKFDLCQKHISKLKEIMRAFSGQDIADVVIDPVTGIADVVKGNAKQS